MKPLQFLFPQSMTSRLMVAILTSALLPMLIIGWIAFNALLETTKQARINDVGNIASLRHDQLTFALDRTYIRAELFLIEQLEHQCKVGNGVPSARAIACLKASLTTFVHTEKAVGGSILLSGLDSPLIVGTPADPDRVSLSLLPGQLAIFPPTKDQASRIYHVPVSAPQYSAQLVMTFPVSLLQEIFPPPRILGESGETFLADAQGFFVTQPRYHSEQGHSMGISAVPMQTCLQKRDAEMLELDYRGAPIIHGFRYIPEIGGGCIMAHFDQQEAFAPLERLKLELFIFAFFVAALSGLIAFYLARQFVRPISELSKVIAQIKDGQEDITFSEHGTSEVTILAETFKQMLERLKQADTRLHEGEKILIESQRIAHLGSWKLDLLTNVLVWSPEIYVIFEIDPKIFGASYEAFLQTIHPDDREMVNQAYTESLKNKQPYSIEHRLLMKDGRIKHVQELCETTYDQNDKPLYSVGTVLDISARKQAERSVREERARLTDLIDSAMDAIVSADENQNIIIFNHGAEQIFGYRAADIIGQPLEKLLPVRYRAMHRQHVEEFGRTGITTRTMNMPGRSYGLRANGEEFPFEASISKAETGGKKVYTAILHDVSVRQQSEEKIRRAHVLLEAVSLAQSYFITGSEHRETFGNLLKILLDFSGSEYGFIGEVLHGTDGKPFLKEHAITNIAWNSETRALYEKHKAQGLEFHNLNTLFGTVLTTGQSVIANDPARDPRAGGLPPGHPAMRSFLGLPLHKGAELIGMIGIANRAGGYNEQLCEELKPLTTTCASLIESWRIFEKRKQDESKLQLAASVYRASHEGIVVTDENNLIIDVNPEFTRLTGYTLDEVCGMNPRIFQSGKHDSEFYRQMWQSIQNDGHWQGEVWDRRKDGELHAKWLNISVIRHPDGSVFRYLGQFSDITEKKRKDEVIWMQANFDALTNLPNRRLLADRLHQSMSSSIRNARHSAMLLLDLDHFKRLNDSLGHSIGDKLLIEVAIRLQAFMREEDTVARMGGDEFIVLINELSNNPAEAAVQAEQISEKIRSELCRPYLLGEAEYYSTTSVGIVLFRGHLDNAEELLAHVDAAMYQAKAKGRNTICFFDSSMQAALERRSQLESALRVALQRNEFILYYQLQINSSDQFIGAEALLRWVHPQLGMVSPAQFIPVAEESGLILPIGHWVLETACAQLASWEADPRLRHLSIAVNVSVRQFREPTFVAQVRDVLKKSGIKPEVLKLELTESLVLDNVEDSIRKMKELRELGVKFSMDDFGTGYSSLAYLTRLPIDQIKIDQSFVRDITTDSSATAIVHAIISMSRSLGIEVIAEGVETEAQREFLELHNCHAYQGYLYAKPLPIADVERKLLV